MRKFVSLLFLSILIPFFGSACSCIGEESVKNAVKKANVVLSGKVIKVEEFTIPMGPINFGNKRIKYVFEVDRFYKGDFETKHFEIISLPGGGDCGFRFENGNKYIVYAYAQTKYYPGGEDVEQYFITDICTRTTKYSKKENRQIKSSQ